MLFCPICQKPVNPVDTAHICPGLGTTFTPNIEHPEMQVQLLRETLVALVDGCNSFRAASGRSIPYIQHIEQPLFAAQSLLAR